MQFASNTPPLILPPLLKLPSGRTCSITMSKLFFTAVAIPLSEAWVCACMCVCMSVVSVIVKRPVLPPCVVDGRSRNPLYYYYYSVIQKFICHTHVYPPPQNWCHTAVICPWHTSTSSTNGYKQWSSTELHTYTTTRTVLKTITWSGVIQRFTCRHHALPICPQNYQMKQYYTQVHFCVCPSYLVRSFQCS